MKIRVLGFVQVDHPQARQRGPLAFQHDDACTVLDGDVMLVVRGHQIVVAENADIAVSRPGTERYAPHAQGGAGTEDPAGLCVWSR